MQITEYNETQAGLERLKERMKGVVYDVTKKEGMASAKADRRELVTLRTSLEAKRKEIKAPALERCRLIDEEAKRVTAEILALEAPIDRQIKEEEARIEAEKQAAIEAERQRVFKIMESIEKIKAVPVRCAAMTSAQLDEQISFVENMPIGDDFYAEFRPMAQAAKTDAYQQLIDLKNVAVELEAEAARIEAERKAEEERLEAERAEAALKLAAEQEKLRLEREAFKREQAEALRLREEEDRKNREAVEAAERILKEKREEEERKLAAERAELKRQQDEMAATLRKAEEEAAALKEAEAAKQREIDRQAAEAAELQKAEAEKARRAEAKARKLAEAKCKDVTTALKQILAICQDHEQTDRYRIEQIAVIAEANI